MTDRRAAVGDDDRRRRGDRDPPFTFSSPRSKFETVTSDSPRHVDRFKLGGPTGEVFCLECHAPHQVVEEIPHDPDCRQRFVTSRWWRRQCRV